MNADGARASPPAVPPHILSALICVYLRFRISEGGTMHFGASMFFTDYSMTAARLAQALETRGFESVWAAEHSHIPTSRRSPWGGGGDLPKQYYDVMDPL